jgi:signal transduction histidine kinase/HAMP domain-containing protein
MKSGTLFRRANLTAALVAINAGLVLLGVVAVLGVSWSLLRDLGDQQALARVELAGAAALERVEHSADELLGAAQLLAERPTLATLLAAEDAAGLEAFLDRFRATAELDGCSVWREGRPVIRVGTGLPWPAIEARWSGGPPANAAASDILPHPEMILLASAPVPAIAGARAMAVRRVDRELQSLGEQIDLGLALLPIEARHGAGPQESELRARALAGGHAAARLPALGDYRDLRVLRALDGTPAALIETRLPLAVVDQPIHALARRLLLSSVLVLLLVVALSVALGHLLARPLRGMAVAADRIGAGDFNVPIPEAWSAELSSLAASMDQMRRELRRLTAELERREAEAQALLGGIVEGVFAVDGDRRIRYLNPQTAALLQVSPAEALGRFCGDVLDPQGAGGVRPCAESCPIVHARSRGSSRAVERLKRPDGTLVTTVITSAPPAHGRQVQVIRDETDVEAARRLRDAVLANVSHEFKTPLSAQLASIELLRDSLEELEQTPTGELVRSLERGTLRLSQLVDNLLESVRIEAGQPGLRAAPVALDAVVDAAAELTGPLFAQRSQRLVIDLPAPLPELLGDAPRLTQVFVNLLANANKFAPAGSEVRVGGEVTDGEIALWVEDSGPGLPQGAGGSIFERFVRAPQHQPAPGGMGLGLWIVKSIVEAHGGRVDARSLATGGTRFSVTLPAGARRERPGSPRRAEGGRA